MALDLFCVHCQRRVTIAEPVLAAGACCPLCRQEVVSAAEVPAEAKAGPRPASQIVLRIVVLLCAVVSAAACLYLGNLWRTQAVEHKEELQIARLFQEAIAKDPTLGVGLADFDRKVQVFPLLFVTAALGLVGGVLAFWRMGPSAGTLMLAALVAPTVVFPQTLLFTAFLAVGGLLSFLIRTRRAALDAALRAVQSEESPALSPKVVYVAASLGGLALLGYAGFLGLVLYKAVTEGSAGTPVAGGRAPGKTINTSPPGPRGNLVPAPTPPPAAGPPAVDFAAIKDEVDRAGEGVKLVKLDLAPAGMDLTIDVPEGSRLKESQGEVHITRDARFALKIRLGRQEFLNAKQGLSYQKVLVNSEDLVFYNSSFGDRFTGEFGLVWTLEPQDFYVTNNRWVNDKSVEHGKAECLLMIKCARTLARQMPFPAGPAAALRFFRSKDDPKDAPSNELYLNWKATDASLALLKHFPETRVLDLHQTQVTDDGLAHLAGLTKLESLFLWRRPISDKGLERLAGLTNLKRLELELGGAPITDEGLRHLAGLVNLANLGLTGAPITDEGLRHLAGLVNLTHLGLSLTKVTGSGFAHFKAITKLESLAAGQTPFGDVGLQNLRGCKNLKFLLLYETEVTDNGLEYLKGMTNLTHLYLNRTKVTGTGFAKAGALEALTFLGLGQTRYSDAGLENLAGMKKLAHINLRGCPLTGAGFAKLGGLTKLEGLLLGGSQLNDAGLKNVCQLSSLTDVELTGTKITDTGLPHLNRLPNLRILVLTGTPITGSGLKDVKALSQVTFISLDKTKVTDANLVHLQNFPAVTGLTLAETPIGDAGLAHLKGLTRLESLDLQGTQVTDKGLHHLTGLGKLRSVVAQKTKVTKAGAQELRKSLPNVIVSVED